MNQTTTAFWGMTINNYDDTDLALIRQGYPEYIKKIVYSLEEGENGTPHIQAFVRLFRQQRMSYMKKLFPGGHFTSLTSDEYIANAEAYAVKLDDTARSQAVIQNNPFPDPVVELVSVIEEAFKSPDLNEYHFDKPSTWVQSQPEEHIILAWISKIEFRRVRATPRLAKFYIGPTYRRVKQEYLRALLAHVFDNNSEASVEIPMVDSHTHTHTHARENISRRGGITDGQDNEGSDDEESGSGQEDDQSEGDEDGESGTDEGYSEGSGDQSDEEDDR